MPPPPPTSSPQTERVLGDPQAVARLEEWVTRYFGDTTPGAASARFHAAVQRLMDDWETWYARSTVDEDDDETDDEAELDDEG